MYAACTRRPRGREIHQDIKWYTSVARQQSVMSSHVLRDRTRRNLPPYQPYGGVRCGGFAASKPIFSPILGYMRDVPPNAAKQRNPKHSPSSRARESISFPNTRSHSTMSVRRRWLRTPRPGTGEGEIGAERHKMASACPLLHTTPCGSSYQGSYKKLPARSQPRCRCQATQQPMATVSASFQSTTQSAHPTSLAPLSNMPDKPVLRHTGRTEEPVNHRTLRGRRGGLSLSRMRGQRSTYARVGFGSLCD